MGHFTPDDWETRMPALGNSMSAEKGGGGEKLKAWGVNNDECGYIIFAETRGKAKSIAICQDGFDCMEFTDPTWRVYRMPAIDGTLKEPSILDWNKHERIYYEAGWYPEDGARSCDGCGRYQYDRIPESWVQEAESGDLCADCRKAERGGEETNDE